MSREAFAILEYQCSTCNRTDFVWNGTDLTPPFSIKCVGKTCVGVMSRVNWHQAVKRKKFIAPIGSRYFTRTTKEHALEIAKSTLGETAPPERVADAADRILKVNPTCLVRKVADDKVIAA